MSCISYSYSIVILLVLYCYVCNSKSFAVNFVAVSMKENIQDSRAFLVLTYPHFLFADFRYRNGIIGVSPSEDEHKIFVELEPRTGTVVRGMKRAQFNIFMRQITSIPATQNLRTTLTPLVWVEEGMSLPDEYVDMLKTRLLQRLRLVDILIPVIIAVCCLVVVIGVAILIRSRSVRKKGDVTNGRESIRPAT